MNILLLFLGFIIVFIIVICYERKIKNLSVKPKNNVHFYVARDKNGSLWLYLGKPIRGTHMFVKGHGRALTASCEFQEFGLNEHDFDKLKWEDEPVEVFIKMED